MKDAANSSPETTGLEQASLTHVSLSGYLDALLAQALAACGFPAESARVVRAGRPEWGELQCNAAFPLAKRLKRRPAEIATELTAKLGESGVFENVAVAGAGFINLTLSAQWLSRWAQAQLASPDLGVVQRAPSLVMLDYGGPNVAKPLHVGHLRSLVIGESLRRILQAVGEQTLTDAHLGDWGLQMGMLIGQIRREYPQLSCFSSDRAVAASALDEHALGFGMETLQNLYPRAAAACGEDPARMGEARDLTAALQAHDPGCIALWRAVRAMSLYSQQKDFAALDTHFDLLLGESDVEPVIGPMLDDLRRRGLCVESDGALVVDVAEIGDTQPMPPLLLAKSDGAALYATTDLATILTRVREHAPDRLVYVVDQRQSLHFEQVFRAAALAGYCERGRLIHAGFGTVNGVDGKPFKTRQGGVARLSDLLGDAIDKARERLSELSGDGHERIPAPERERLARSVGIAAVKFADLSSYRMSGYVFDPERMVSFEGRNGPYVQYACVRIRSMMGRAEARGLKPGTMRVAAPAERSLAFECARFAEVVASAADLLAPNELAEYAFQLAQAFNRFYLDCPVLAAQDCVEQRSRLALSSLTGRILAKCLNLLGIDVPQRM
ncbi:arginine--tRNA ligase [Stenotrophomonas lacuserhaii]|uniref:arginine--tRNA ligase n=1 Tax=Stenotrophomonas lacuserhaii TaxID=2760084 RepID=UPI0015FA8340|nr:arginine--tRNA ligase [Stenotrophomonas lacuserhaii]